jgi:hypothetical protein
MRSFHVPKLTLVVSIIGLSVTLAAVPIALDGAKIGTGVAGALAQSPTISSEAGTPSAASSGRLEGSVATAGVTNPVASGGLGRTSGITPAMGNPTPAFGRTPTPAISSNSTPALSSAGGTATSVRGAASTRAAGAASDENSVSANVSAEGARNVGVAGNASRALKSVSGDGRSERSASGTVNLVDDPGNANGMEGGVGVGGAGNRNDRLAASDIDSDFVMVGNTATAANVPMAPSAQFAMVCRSSDQIGCRAPPMFIIRDE